MKDIGYKKNTMILNGEDIGISKIELDMGRLRITDKSSKYCLVVCVEFNLDDVEGLEIGQKKNIDFNEYYLFENNEPALIWPSFCLVERISSNILSFHLKFVDLSSSKTCYMNERGHFDVNLDSLEVKIYVDKNDMVNNSLIYTF